MQRTTALMVALALGYAFALVLAVGAQQAPSDGPQYTSANELVLPANYREWTFVSSGIGMAYVAPGAVTPASPTFNNIFVNPSSYRSFMQTGRWPDKTMFILEFRNSAGEASINKTGRFQSGLAGVEAEVKDSRFPDGWAFFGFGAAGSMKSAVAPLAGEAVAACVECHTMNTAVERTFVQFYPTLMDVARQKGTVKPGF